MKRSKTLRLCLAVACMAALFAIMTGCSSQQQNYTPPQATPTVSTPAIAKEGTLRVGVNTQNAPLAGQPASSTKVVGIDVDMAAALADTLGLKLEVVDVGSDPSAALTDGRVDLVMGIDSSDTSLTFWKSEAYLPTAVALFSTPSNSTVPTNSSKPKIAAQVSSKSAWAVTNEFDQGAITTTEDLKSAFSSLESGQVQYVAADAIIGTYAAHSAGNEVQVVALMQQPSGYSVGILDGNTDLKQAVSDALATLKNNGMVSVIETKWLGTALNLESTPLTAGATSSSSSNTSKTTANTDNAEEGTPAADTPAEGTPATDTPAEGTETQAEGGEQATPPDNTATDGATDGVVDNTDNA